MIAAYAGAWRNNGTTVIGPVIAPDVPAAQALITSLARRVHGPVRVDLDPDRDIADWAAARGLPLVDETTFMVHGGPWSPRGAHDHLFCPITVALG